MAKFKFIEKLKKVKKLRKSNISEKLRDWGAFAIDLVKEIFEETVEILEAGKDMSFALCGGIVEALDNILLVADWAVTKVGVWIGREIHDLHMLIIKHVRVILKNLLILGGGCLIMVIIFSWATDYEYSYHGRPLGIVEEQRDVIEILDLASEELSKEYGSSIVIDPETDITFRPVTSYGKEIDNQDTVLKRLTYMGEINAQVTAIVVDGKPMIVVENETVAKEVLQELKDMYITDADTVEYEYIGFAEDVKIEPYSTTLKNVSGKKAALQKLLSGGQAAVEYTIKDGDTLYDICLKNDLTISDLEAMNPGIGERTLLPGDTINLQKVIPLLTLETVEVATYAEVVPYETVYENSSSYYAGEKVLGQAGVDGKDSVTARLTKQNGEIIKKDELKRERIIEPTTEIILKGTKAPPPTKGTGTFIYPSYGVLTSEFGYRWGRNHDGIDVAGPVGTPIYASDGGTVVLSGWYYGYGLTIKIDHGGGFVTLYGHNSENYVSVGQKVFQGQTIAAMGNTGYSTGPHVHFELLLHGTPQNPFNYF